MAFKNAVGARRASWRIINSVETKEMSRNCEENAQLAAEYRSKVEVELNRICGDVIALLCGDLIPASATNAAGLS